MQIRPSDATLGAEVTGIDLRNPLSDADFAEIENAWHDRGVLIFPGQNLTDEQHLAFTRRFGRLELSIRRNGSNLSRLSNVDKDGNVVPRSSLQARFLLGNTYWHSDSSYKSVGLRHLCWRRIRCRAKAGRPNGPTCGLPMTHSTKP
jgi:alpha-ketoglutarate-dependent taurine dioxygenase